VWPRLDERRIVNGDTTPTLDSLSQNPTPAWLWDAERLRVVWANRAGIALWGGETLFDLIDRRFSVAEPGVARLDELFKELSPGRSVDVRLSFAGVAGDVPFKCRCHHTLLNDDRPGLLVTAEQPGEEARDLEGGLSRKLIETLPTPLAVVERSGEMVYCNAAARALWAYRQPASLADVTATATVADELMSRAAGTGLVSEVRRIETRFGTRQHRLHIQPVPGEDGVPLRFLIQFDDVTERRELEHEMRDRMDRLTDLVAATATFTWEIDAQLRFTAFDGETATDLAGTSWQAFAESHGLDASGVIATALLEQTAWRVEVNWPSPDGLKPVHLSAVPRFSADGAFAGYRGIGAPGALAPPAVAATAEPPVPLEHDGPEPLEPEETKPPHLSAEDEAAFRHIGETLSDEEPAAPAETLELVETPAYTDLSDHDLRTILDTATDGVLTLDDKGIIESINASAQAMFGYDTQESVGRAIQDFLTAESAKTVRDYLAALCDGGLARIFNDGREIVAIEKQGGEIPLFVTIGRIVQDTDKASAKQRFCAVIRDITQWKRTEAELRRAKDTAERANAQKSEFLANISHELRTPLNAIIGFSEVMKTEKFGTISNDRYRGYVTDIHASGEHLLSLINDLLDLSKVEAGKLELNFTSVDLGDIVQQCIGIIQEQATRERIIIRTSVAERLPNVVADHRSMRQILLNLLSNAVKFTDKGGQVIVSALLDDDGQVKLRVKDTGVGMSDDELIQAMEPFQRVERTQRSDKPGTGLGLPLTKALAEANRAAFAIESEPGKGTRVQITFPTTRVLAD